MSKIRKSKSQYKPSEQLSPRHYRLERAFSKFRNADIALRKATEQLTRAMNETTEQMWGEAVRNAALANNFKLFRAISLEKQRREFDPVMAHLFVTDQIPLGEARTLPESEDESNRNKTAALRMDQLEVH